VSVDEGLVHAMQAEQHRHHPGQIRKGRARRALSILETFPVGAPGCG
jgi:hypothetical protein